MYFRLNAFAHLIEGCNFSIYDVRNNEIYILKKILEGCYYI